MAVSCKTYDADIWPVICPYCRASMMIKMLYYGPLKVNATIAITSHTKWYMICTYSYIFSSLKAQFSSPKTKWGMCSFLQSQMLEVCQNKRLKWRTHKQNQRQRINSTAEPVLNPESDSTKNCKSVN